MNVGNTPPPPTETCDQSGHGSGHRSSEVSNRDQAMAPDYASDNAGGVVAGERAGAMNADLLRGLQELAAASGVSMEQLADLVRPSQTTQAYTVSAYIARVEATLTPGSRKTYLPYLKRLAGDCVGTLPLAAVTVTDLEGFVQRSTSLAAATRGERRNARGGRSAQENTVAALRWLFSRAVKDKHRTDNPALGLKKPARARTPRRGLTTEQLTELIEATSTGGNDPALDTLLVRFMLESGARRSGMISLRLRDLDPEACTVLLREKNDPDGTPQPVSPAMVNALSQFARSRGSKRPDDPVFRYRPKVGTDVGAPLTARRFNTLADRWQNTLPWAARLGVSPHTLRHTAIGLVEHLAGYAVAREFARHRDQREVTTTYLGRDISDVAFAVQQLTGQPHPLAKDRFS